MKKVLKHIVPLAQPADGSKPDYQRHNACVREALEYCLGQLIDQPMAGGALQVMVHPKMIDNQKTTEIIFGWDDGVTG